MGWQFAMIIGGSLLVAGCGGHQPLHNEARFQAAVAQVPAAAEKDPAQAAAKNRKIIYKADLELVTEDLDSFRKRLTSTLDTVQGFVAAEQLTGRKGQQRTGVWTVRIPEVSFSSFLQQVATWAELETQRIHSDDVTEEFVDIEARVKNKRVEEQRLLEILEKKTGELKDVVAVERAISEVREQLERMEGRLRYLMDKVELTTVTLSVREIENYIPPQPPTLATEITRTFSGSVRSLSEFGKQLLLILVALTPWIALLSLVLVPVALFFRRQLRRRHFMPR